MAEDSLFFTLKGMEELYDEANGYTKNFSAAIEELDRTIEGLNNYWQSTETKTYETFYQLYKEKKAKLIDAKDLMIEFCKKVEEKKKDFEEGDKAIIRRYD